MRKLLAALKLCNLLVILWRNKMLGSIGSWDRLYLKPTVIKKSIKSLKVDSFSGAKEQRKICSSCLLVTNAQFSKPPLCQVHGWDSRQRACGCPPKRESCARWLSGMVDDFFLLWKEKKFLVSYMCFSSHSKKLRNIQQNLEAATDSFSLSQNSLRTWQILNQNLQTPEDKKPEFSSWDACINWFRIHTVLYL